MNQDIQKLQGAWLVTALEVDGRRIDPATFPGAKVVISGRRFESFGMGSTYEGDVSVDEAASPKNFSFSFTNGPEKGNTNLGIYELANETWKICLNTSGKERPREFSTRAGSGDALEILTRENSSMS